MRFHDLTERFHLEAWIPVVLACSLSGCTSLQIEPGFGSASTINDFHATESPPSAGESGSDFALDDQSSSKNQLVNYQLHSSAFSVSQAIEYARSQHPQAIASKRRVQLAETRLEIAGSKENPEFVMDVDTPVHDSNDATELSTRITFPIGQSKRRRGRIRVARASLHAAKATHDATLRQLAESAQAAATRLAYLQQRLTYTEQASRLAEEKLQYLDPEQRDGDASNNLVRYVNASSESVEMRHAAMETQRDLVLARVELAEAMGIDLSVRPELVDSISISEPLQIASFELPSLESVVAAAIADSSAIHAADLNTRTGWAKYDVARNQSLPFEAGPRYQDRLGRDDDTIGVRFQTDIPIHDNKTPVVHAAGAEAAEQEVQVQIVRHQVASAAARDYSELKFVAAQLVEDTTEDFVVTNERLLDDETAMGELTGDQIVEIQLAIIKRQLSRLELEYRFTTLRSKLRLHAAY